MRKIILIIGVCLLVACNNSNLKGVSDGKNEEMAALLTNGKIDEVKFKDAFHKVMYNKEKREPLLTLLGTSFLQAVDNNKWKEADRLLNLEDPTLINYSDRVEPFKKALDADDVARIKKMLEHDFLQDVDDRGVGGGGVDFSGPIEYALAQNDAGKIRMLLAAGFPLNEPRWISQLLDKHQEAVLQEVVNAQGLPTLMEAGFASYANTVDYLLKSKKYSQEELNVAFVRVFVINQECDCSHVSEGKNLSGMQETAEILLAHGADVNGTIGGENPCYTSQLKKCTALQEILSANCLPEDVRTSHARFLLEHGADAKGVLYLDDSLLSYETKKGVNGQSQDNESADKYASSLYSREEVKAAYEFAAKIKEAVKRKDIVTFADFIGYPVQVNQADKSTSIRSKGGFIQLGAAKVFTDQFIQEVCKEEELFISYRGFMMGNGPNLFFDFAGPEHKLEIYGINLE